MKRDMEDIMTKFVHFVVLKFINQGGKIEKGCKIVINFVFRAGVHKSRAPCRLAAQDFEVALRFLENVCTPVLGYRKAHSSTVLTFYQRVECSYLVMYCGYYRTSLYSV